MRRPRRTRKLKASNRKSLWIRSYANKLLKIVSLTFIGLMKHALFEFAQADESGDGLPLMGWILSLHVDLLQSKASPQSLTGFVQRFPSILIQIPFSHLSPSWQTLRAHSKLVVQSKKQVIKTDHFEHIDHSSMHKVQSTRRRCDRTSPKIVLQWCSLRVFFKSSTDGSVAGKVFSQNTEYKQWQM